VGFANAGVVVALNTGSSFAAPKTWIASFAIGAGGWAVDKHPRMLVDVNSDGLPDVVGFADAGVVVALNTGSSFGAPRTWIADFGYGPPGGWRVHANPRMLVDVNADGRPDVVGFANAGVVVALNTGSSFAAPKTWIASFAIGAGGWEIGKHPRTVAVRIARPGPPRSVSAAPGDGSAVVSWVAPASDGGSPVTGYVATAVPGGESCSTLGGLSCTVWGLTNGTRYSFTVRASNRVGEGPVSEPSGSVTPKDAAKCAAADVSKDGRVNVLDLSMLLSDWKTSAPRTDLNADGTVNIFDLSIMLSMWGPCPVYVAPQGAQQLGAASVVGGASADTHEARVLKGLGGNAEVLAQSSDGRLFGHASTDFGSNGGPVVWANQDAAPEVVVVAGAKDLVITDVTSAGLAVGIGLAAGSDDKLAWYRKPDGTTGLLQADGASRVVARSVDESGRVGGFLMKDVAVPVVWDSVTAAPRYLPLPSDDSGAAVTAASEGRFAGATQGDRLAIWDPSGPPSVSVPDGEAIDMNAAGQVLFGSATAIAAPPRVRMADGTLVGLPDAADAAGRTKRASAISSAGSVVGSYSERPVIWPAAGRTPTYLPVPVGATSGRVLGFGTGERLVGWAQSRTGRVPVVWAPRPAVTPSVLVRVKAVAGGSKLFVDVDPNKGRGYWRFQVQQQRKSGSWKALKTYTTKGTKETRTINLKRGTYRVVVRAKYGYQGATSAEVFLKK
jgi:hypothetical protein